jgi:pyruvate decarboxylase
MEVSKLPTFVTGMGKGSVNEQHAQFGGVYAGAATKPDVKEVVESADCVLWVGNYPVSLPLGQTVKLNC